MVNKYLNQPFADVTGYKAKGSPTDDTTAIQNAINDLGTAGGILFFPAGTYRASTLNFSTYPITVLGAGKTDSRAGAANIGSTLVQLANANTDFLIFGINGTQTDGGGLQSIGIDGNKANQSSGNTILLNGRQSFNINDVMITRAWDTGLVTKISGGTNAAEIHIVNSQINDCGIFGIDFQSGSAGISIVNTNIHRIGSNAGAGASAYVNLSAPQAIIENSVFSADGVSQPTNSEAVRINGAGNHILIGNIFNGAGQKAGIELLNAANHNVIIGNSFQDSPGITGSGSYILITSGSRNIIANNLITSVNFTPLNGINEISPSDYNQIIGNLVYATTNGIITAGAHTLSLGNRTPSSGGFSNDILGTSSPATSATAGFPYIPIMAGAPTGIPTATTGYAPIVWDDTNKKFWIYSVAAASWKGIVLT